MRTYTIKCDFCESAPALPSKIRLGADQITSMHLMVADTGGSRSLDTCDKCQQELEEVGRGRRTQS